MPYELTESKREGLLHEIRTRYVYADQQWHDIKAEAKEDMRYVAGDPWSQSDKAKRKDAGRPCLSLDELGQYFNQTINSVRANPRAMKFDPTGNGADEKTAEFYQNKAREIEYRSQARIAYTTAFQDCIHRSYGWVRLNTKHVHARSFEQDIWIEDVPNPDLVLPDPDFTRPNFSDGKYLFYLQTYTGDEFKREFPDAKHHSFSPEIIGEATAWVEGDKVTVAEYWKVESEQVKLILFQMPDGSAQAFFEDELPAMPDGVKAIKTEVRERPRVCMYLTNGIEILKKQGQASERVEWAGKYIPFASCVGMTLYVDEGGGSKKVLMSMTRMARDPQMYYNWLRTSQMEMVGMSTKFPYFAYRGSLTPESVQDIAKSLHEPQAVIMVEHSSDTFPPGFVPPLPQRNPWVAEVDRVEMLAEAARRGIQAAMGISPLPTPMQRDNQKSGKALQRIEESGQRGSFHFVDHYDAMIQHVGVMVEDLMTPILDTPRQTGIREANDTAKIVQINGPGQVSTKGDHSVTVSTGPAYTSQREEAQDFADTLVQNVGTIAQIAGPKPAAALMGLSVKLKQLGPIGDEIVKIITPPEYQQGQQPPSPELMAMQGQFQQAQQIIQELGRKLETDALKRQTDLEKAQMDNATKIEIARMQATAQIEVADIKAGLDALKADVSALKELRLERENQAHQTAESHRQHVHEAALSTMEHEQAKELAQTTHEHAIDQATHQAAVTPAPKGAEA